MNPKARKGMLAALMGAAFLAGAGAAWAQTSEPDTPPAGYGYKYRPDMDCGESWIKVCEL